MGKYVISKNSQGYTFNLKADNGEVIGTSGEVITTLGNVNKSIDSVRKNAPIAAVEDQTVDGYKQEKNPKFEIYLDKAGEYRFRLKAANGEKILASEGYTTKANCKNGINSVVKNAPSTTVEGPDAD
ncbi:MAG: YegP family protein [Clostridiales bacterium]|nr:YegP family protein [Clostridiales bacterium]